MTWVIVVLGLWIYAELLLRRARRFQHPVEGACRGCGGSGEQWRQVDAFAKPEVRACPDCDGSGREEDSKP